MTTSLPDDSDLQDSIYFQKLFLESLKKKRIFLSKNDDSEPNQINKNNSIEASKIREINLSKSILNELKGFSDEDLILIYDKTIRAKDLAEKKESNGFYFIEKYSNFKEIRNSVIQELTQINNIIEIQKIFNKVRELKKISVPLNHLKDAKNDHRLCVFSYNFIKNLGKNKEIKFYYNESPYLNINHLVMVRSDFIVSRHPKNIKESQRIFVSKIRLKNNLKVLSDKKFNDWAYDYLINNNVDFSKIDYYPINHNQRSNLIISFLDYLAYFNKDEHESLTKNLYRAWTQKKFRDSKKTSLNPYASLSKDVKKYLTEISKKEGKTEEIILSDLICDKYLMLNINKEK